MLGEIKSTFHGSSNMLKWFKQILQIGEKASNADHSIIPGADTPAIGNSATAGIGYKNKGDAFLDQGDWASAILCYLDAIEMNPDYFEAHNNLGLALIELRRYDEAARHLKKALLLKPYSFNTHYILGMAAHKCGNLDEAVKHFSHAVSIKPDFAEAFDYMGLLLREQGLLKQSIDCYRKAISISPQTSSTYSSLLFTLQFDNSLNPADLFAEHRRFAERFETPLTHLPRRHTNARSHDRRLKIGYVSPDFRRHSVALFMIPILSNHNSERFEIYCYYNYSAGDEYTARFAELADQFIPCAMMSDEELSDRISADGIDILVDLAGHTAHNRLLVFARKPAPIQITYLGYPGTTGLSSMDYRLTDRYTEPEGDQHYTEKLLRMPDSMWCYQADEEMPAVTALSALENGYLTFGSFNNFNKIGDECIGLWATLLLSLPTSRLLVATVPEGDARERLARKFQERGVSPDRLSFHGQLPRDAFQRLLRQVDVTLDPFPVNGATTTCESLLMGVPVLGLVGNRFLSRAGLSILSAANMCDFAATTPEDFIAKAGFLASNLPLLSELRAALREKLKATPLLDQKRFTHNLEAIYRDIWSKWCDEGNSGNATAEMAPDKQVQNHGPEDALALKNKGDACLDTGDWAAAEACYRQSISCDSSVAATYNNLGLALLEQGRFEEAANAVKQAIAVDAKSFNAHYILGMIAYRLGEPRAAVENLRNATLVNPEFSDAFNYMGNILTELGDTNGAATAYQRAIAINPDVAEYYYNIAGIVLEQGNKAESIACYQRALALSPAFNTARLALIHQMQQICDWDGLDENIALARQYVREGPYDPDARDSPFSFLALPGATALEQRICAEKWTNSSYQMQMRLREHLAFTFVREPSSKIKIGYLSADFHTHATAMLMAEVFELHDRDRFHITAYSYGPDDKSPMRDRLKNTFDEFVDIEKDTFVESAQRIYQNRIDILVDLKGYTGNSRSAILALRPAPIQVNFLGYPGTMGADFVDYLISDRFITPPQYSQYYSEKIAYLPDCYQPNDRARPRPMTPSRLSQQLPQEGIVFCCFNQTYKITPDMFDIWCRLLSAVPESHLWLLSHTPETEVNLRREATKRGVNENRLSFASRLSMEDHLARLQCADIFLDTLPYNAHTTCSEALWMGLPVVTCTGETFSSRVAGSLLSAVGCPELVTHNRADYYDLALELAVNHEKRIAIRNKIMANRDTAPLFDSARFTRNLENAYDEMLRDKEMAANKAQ